MSGIYGVEDLDIREERYQTVDGDVLEEADVCIIGSGAAGSVLAKKLAEAGRSVVLLERGGYFEGEDMNQRDEDMLPLLWKNSGANFSDDLRTAIAQGSCLGGSTVINDAVCFPIPDLVKREWRRLGVGISDEEWDYATKEVSEIIHVSGIADDEININNNMLKRGCSLMGYENHGPNLRNCVNCMRCGLCHLGCHYETKHDMRVTYLHEALNDPGSNLRIYCNCRAEKITATRGVADGVEGDFLDRIGNVVFKLRVNARIVIVAAGAIASTELLMKNFIAEGKAGKGLSLHPAPFVIGDFPFEIKAHQGVPMAYTLHDFGVTNGVEDGGFLIESSFLPPLQFSMALPALGGLMKRYGHYAMAGVLVRDDPRGEVSLSDLGFSRVSYRPGTKELDAMARGAELIARMWFRLGATRVITSHLSKSILNGEKEISDLKDAIKRDPDRLLLGSAHPQGGNRMGDDPRSCVVDSSCKVFGFENLFVCDASVFPTALGVNPQLTIMALAAIISDRIDGRWNEFASLSPRARLGEVCSTKQPMRCKMAKLKELFDEGESAFGRESLVNSPNMKIVDGENWSFDVDDLTIWNNRYRKGFYASDDDPLTKGLVYALGFYKRFWRSGDSVRGETHPYYSDIYAANEASDVEYPEYGKITLLQYFDPPYNLFYDILKIVDKDTLIGEAFGFGSPPEGKHVFYFILSRRYNVDFMTHDDFEFIFSNKAKAPEAREVPGVWEARLVSDPALSPVVFRFRYFMEDGELKARFILGGVLPIGGTGAEFSKDLMEEFDLAGRAFKSEIRMVRRDFMLGKFCDEKSSIFGMLERSTGFIIKDERGTCVHYVLRRVG
ncbi:MAG TPA: GMC family oxidoreductase [Methanothrix sp.]|nr:GMC family oxidoreductase [Methanothrix sp.]